MNVQDILIEIRRAGYSQARIADAIGLEQPSVSRWEAGEIPVSATAALRLVGLRDQVRASAKRKRRTPTAGT